MKLTDPHVDCMAMPNAPVSPPLALLYAPSTYNSSRTTSVYVAETCTYIHMPDTQFDLLSCW